MQVWSTGSASGTEAGAYWLRAPAGTSITGLAYAGTFDSYGGWVAHWATAQSGDGDPTSDCAKTQNCVSQFTSAASFAVANVPLIGFRLWCDESTCAANSADSLYGPAGSANVYNATVTINDPNAPTPLLRSFGAAAPRPYRRPDCEMLERRAAKAMIRPPRVAPLQTQPSHSRISGGRQSC